MSSPATAGPTSRAPLKIVEFRLTALVSSAGPTISDTNDCRTGTSTAETAPSAAGQQEDVPELDDVGRHEEPEAEREQRPSAPG